MLNLKIHTKNGFLANKLLDSQVLFGKAGPHLNPIT